jgi:predicted small lipoprotein YifL
MRTRISIALLLLAPLAACGQKGALYLPDEQREPVTTTDAAAAGASGTDSQPAPGASDSDATTDRSNEARKRPN